METRVSCYVTFGCRLPCERLSFHRYPKRRPTRAACTHIRENNEHMATRLVSRLGSRSCGQVCGALSVRHGGRTCTFRRRETRLQTMGHVSARRERYERCSLSLNRLAIGEYAAVGVPDVEMGVYTRDCQSIGRRARQAALVRVCLPQRSATRTSAPSRP